MLNLYLNFNYLPFIFTLSFHVLNSLFLIHITFKAIDSEKLFKSMSFHSQHISFLHYKKKKKSKKELSQPPAIESTNLLACMPIFPSLLYGSREGLNGTHYSVSSLDPYLPPFIALYAFILQSDSL